MFEMGITLFLGLILLLAMIHTLGEVIYKKGTTSLLGHFRQKKSEFLKFKKNLFPFIIIVVSICISLLVKIIYGIILGKNPLSITAGSFLGSIAIFSIIFGKLFFDEQFSRYQLLGIIMIVLGILLLV